jgi:hypothetical protein
MLKMALALNKAFERYSRKHSKGWNISQRLHGVVPLLKQFIARFQPGFDPRLVI